MAKTTIATRMCKGYNSKLGCIGEIKETEFYETWSPYTDGKVAYCKKCCDAIFNDYIEKGCTARSALYFTLMKLDIPFIEEIYLNINDISQKGNKNGKRVPISVGSYISALHKRNTMKDIYTDFSATDVDIADIDTKIEQREVKQKELDQWEIDWGIQEDIKDYTFLQMTFDKYTNGVVFVNSQQEDLYRDLCRDRLLLRKINDSRYKGEESLDTIQKRIDREMSKLKLDDFESNKPKTLSEQLIAEKIAMIEQNKPADLYKEPKKYKDFNKLRKYYKDMVLRPLLNTLCGHRDFDIDLNDLTAYNLECDEE